MCVHQSMFCFVSTVNDKNQSNLLNPGELFARHSLCGNFVGEKVLMRKGKGTQVFPLPLASGDYVNR